jgi:hypothetical protein
MGVANLWLFSAHACITAAAAAAILDFFQGQLNLLTL